MVQSVGVMCVITMVRCLDCGSCSRPRLLESCSSGITLTAVVVTDVICNVRGCQRISAALRLLPRFDSELAECSNPTCDEVNCRIDLVDASCRERWVVHPENCFSIRSQKLLPGELSGETN